MNEHIRVFPVWLGLLGSFRLLRDGQPVPVRAGGKTQALLSHLGLANLGGLPRELLLNLLWPDSDLSLAANAFNNLVHNLRGLLSESLGGVSPIVQSGGYCRLNLEAGVGIDVAEFKTLAARAEQFARSGAMGAAAEVAERAIKLYRGDLHLLTDTGPLAMLERDRLRATCLSMLILLADNAFACAQYAACLNYVVQLLAFDPCREDAHRLVMRCHVRRGERAQALRHYATVQRIMRAEFDAGPEPSTVALYEQIRLNPGAV